eukprot:1939025-Pyramimonas_sp.AAC.1
MASNAPLVQIAGVVRAPLASTFVVPEAFSVIDYFIVSKHLDFAAGQVFTDVDASYSPHRPVCFSVKRALKDIYVKVP